MTDGKLVYLESGDVISFSAPIAILLFAVIYGNDAAAPICHVPYLRLRSARVCNATGPIVVSAD